MTAALRQHLRHAIDQAKRQRLQTARGNTNTCANCGCHPDNQTTGCKPCHDRHRRRRRRNDPSVLATEQAQQRARRQAART